MALAFIMKWDPSIHGISDNENDLINYFKTKFLVMELVWGDGENSFDSDMSLEDNIIWYQHYHNRTQNYNYKLVPIKKTYRYKDRDFAIINYGLEKFQRRYKKYYAAKMIHFKSLRNIYYKQIHSKYPKFKYKF